MNRESGKQEGMLKIAFLKTLHDCRILRLPEFRFLPVVIFPDANVAHLSLL